MLTNIHTYMHSFSRTFDCILLTTFTNVIAQTHRYTQTLTYTHTPTHRHRHTHRHTQTHTHTHTHIYIYIYTQQIYYASIEIC